MKRLALIAACILLLPGCDATQKALKAFQKANPDKVAVEWDEDGDGIADFYAVAGADGRVALNADGKPAEEVPNTRAILNRAKADDSLISNEIAAIAALFGVGGTGLTYLGKLWGRVKPAQRAQLWQGRFEDTVESIQIYRQKLNEKEKDTMNAKVGRVLSDTKAAIDDVKAKNFI